LSNRNMCFDKFDNCDITGAAVASHISSSRITPI